MSTPILKIEHLSHQYSKNWAIKDINIEINQNGVYGLLGSNGAGKSTTMNILCGVLKPTQGNVYVKGFDISKQPIAAKRHIGFLPQIPPLHLDLNVSEYLRYCAKLHYITGKDADRAVEDVLDKCKISHFAKRVLRNLSGGYQQRVGIAQAIVHKPEIVVFDEPTNGLDPNQIKEIRNLIKEIAIDSTVILSTHILPEVQATCDYIRMIEKGCVVFEGSMSEFDNYVQKKTLVVRFDVPPALEDLVNLDGVVRVELLESDKYRVQFTDRRLALDQILRRSFDGDWQISEIQEEKASLEEIFALLSK